MCPTLGSRTAKEQNRTAIAVEAGQKVNIYGHARFPLCLHCFDTVGCPSGRACIRPVKKLSDEVLVWLSVFSDVRIVSIWSS